MARDNCTMCTTIGNDVFCGYYDVGFMTCAEIPFSKCPDGLDNEDDDDDDEYYYDEENDA